MAHVLVRSAHAPLPPPPFVNMVPRRFHQGLSLSFSTAMLPKKLAKEAKGGNHKHALVSGGKKGPLGSPHSSLEEVSRVLLLPGARLCLTSPQLLIVS